MALRADQLHLHNSDNQSVKRARIALLSVLALEGQSSATQQATRKRVSGLFGMAWRSLIACGMGTSASQGDLRAMYDLGASLYAHIDS